MKLQINKIQLTFSAAPPPLKQSITPRTGRATPRFNPHYLMAGSIFALLYNNDKWDSETSESTQIEWELVDRLRGKK